MSNILKLILNDEERLKIKAAIKKQKSKLSFYMKYKELENSTLFEYFNTQNNLNKYTLQDLIVLKAVDITELNDLMQSYIKVNHINNVRTLLLNGVTLTKKNKQLTNNNAMQAFFNYQPGANQPTIFSFCSSRKRDDNYLTNLEALLMDYSDTTSGSSSEAETISEENLSSSDLEKLDRLVDRQFKKYEDNPDTATGLRLVAARGVHFCPKYFTKDTVQEIKNNRYNQHPTYSQSTLFDAGFEADGDVSEDNTEIQERHAKNMQFIEHLKEKHDQKEKRITTLTPAVTRNEKLFENHFYRYMQVYINSYSRLFTHKSIMSDFGFDTVNNPEVSLSWFFHKGAAYGNGQRFDSLLRKDPHYRRFTGKPKHPNMGYLDVYAFDIDYVKQNGFDRQLMCAAGFIGLSAMYRSEGEIIFHSMLPSKFHQGRHILSLPSFEGDYAKSDKVLYGLSKKNYNKLKDDIRTLPADKNSDSYQEVLTQIIKKAALAQGELIEKTTHCRLFREKKVVVHDHGDCLSKMPFKL